MGVVIVSGEAIEALNQEGYESGDDVVRCA